jgi:hypothetical protein
MPAAHNSVTGLLTFPGHLPNAFELAQVLHYTYQNLDVMKKRTTIYFSKSRALKILESPLKADLKTLLSATFAIAESRVVKRHIQNTLVQLDSSSYRLSA